MKQQKGITITTLVLTVIVLLILAGITISLTIGKNGIITRAGEAGNNYLISQNQELADIAEFSNVMGDMINGINQPTTVTANGEPAMASYQSVDTVPIPTGFSYLEGTKETGFVIKNNTDGNEFVWIPVVNTVYGYNRNDFGKQTGEFTQYQESLSEEEQTSISLYGGFYLGRYDTGITGQNSEVQTQNSSNLVQWTGYTGGRLVIQKNQQVWNYITREQATAEAKNLYTKSRDGVSSKLCSSYTWDTALRFIETTNIGWANNSLGGVYSSSNIMKTGISTSVNNIYDMGGNVWKWTSENYQSNLPVIRGGNYQAGYSEYPASYRHYASPTEATQDIGFRICMFL